MFQLMEITDLQPVLGLHIGDSDSIVAMRICEGQVNIQRPKKKKKYVCFLFHVKKF